MTTRNSATTSDAKKNAKPIPKRRGFGTGISFACMKRRQSEDEGEKSEDVSVVSDDSYPQKCQSKTLVTNDAVKRRGLSVQKETLPSLDSIFAGTPAMKPNQSRDTKQAIIEDQLRQVLDDTPVIGGEPVTSVAQNVAQSSEVQKTTTVPPNELMEMVEQQNRFGTNNMVFKDNRLVNASYKLSVNHMRLILVAIAKAGNEPINGKSFYRITARDLIAAGVPKTSVSAVMRDAYEGLYNESIDLTLKVAEDGSEEHVRLRWVDVVKYNPTNSYVDLCFGGHIAKFISGLSQTFTAFQLSTIRDLKSFKSIRIYEMINQFRLTGRCVIPIDDLLYRLQAKSRNSSELRKRILDPAIQEIKKATKLNVSYELKASCGRKFDTILFSWPVNNGHRVVEDTEAEIQLTTKQAYYFATLLHSDNAFRAEWGKGRLENWKKLLPVIQEELQDPSRMEYFLPWLKKYNFDPEFKRNIRRKKAKDEEPDLFDTIDVEPQDLH